MKVITPLHYKPAHGLILIYDVTDINTFKNMRNWIRHMQILEKTYINKVLVGNKCHEPKREVTEEEGKKLAEEFGLAYFETSTETNQNINEVFEYLARDILNNYDKIIKKTSLLKKDNEQKERKKGCAK